MKKGLNRILAVLMLSSTLQAASIPVPTPTATATVANTFTAAGANLVVGNADMGNNTLSVGNMGQVNGKILSIAAPCVLAGAGPSGTPGGGSGSGSGAGVGSTGSATLPEGISSSGLGTNSGLNFLPITDTSRVDMTSCDSIFNPPPPLLSLDKLILKKYTNILYCYYLGFVIDPNNSNQTTCQSGIPTGVSSPTPGKKIVCDLVDGEGTAASPAATELNHIGDHCGDPASQDSKWENSENNGILVQATKYFVNEVNKEIASPLHVLNIQSQPCQMMASDYVNLMQFSKKISDTVNAGTSISMPNSTQFDSKYCAAPAGATPDAAPSISVSQALPMSSRCFSAIARGHLTHLFSQIAECEILNRTETLKATYMGQSVMGGLTVVTNCYNWASSDGNNYAHSSGVQTQNGLRDAACFCSSGYAQNQGQQRGNSDFNNCYESGAAGNPSIRTFYSTLYRTIAGQYPGFDGQIHPFGSEYVFSP